MFWSWITFHCLSKLQRAFQALTFEWKKTGNSIRVLCFSHALTVSCCMTKSYFMVSIHFTAQATLATCFQSDYLLSLFFDHENGGDMFLRNIGWLSTDYTALYPRRYDHCRKNLKSYIHVHFPVIVNCNLFVIPLIPLCHGQHSIAEWKLCGDLTHIFCSVCSTSSTPSRPFIARLLDLFTANIQYANYEQLLEGSSLFITSV
jgi:hypothetical protein